MLEETYIAGAAPDIELVYALRREASTELSLPKLLKMISPTGFLEFRIACYLGMAFGVPIPLLKDLSGEITLYKTFDTEVLGEPANNVIQAILDRQPEWSRRIP